MARKRTRLVNRRAALGFTQETFARRVKVEPSTVGRWERGTQDPQPWMRPAIAKALGVSIEELDALLAGEPRSPVLPETGETFGPAVAEHVRRSQAEWLRIRRAAGARGRELAELAAWLYPAGQRAPGGHVLVGPGWLLDQPVELESVRLEFSDAEHPVPRLDPVDHVLPLTARGDRYAGYSRAVRDLVRPRLLENRLSYRLLDVSASDGLTLTFGTTTFFEVFDVKESLAHEFKSAWYAAGGAIPHWDALPLRSAIGDPFDPSRLLMSPGINTLTIRRSSTGDHRFVLHERDGAAVADGRDICSLMPAGEFQPSSVSTVDIRNDFSLWRNIMREYSEEFLGNPEHDGNGARRIDYGNEEPFASFERARNEGRFRLWHYGLIMDPLRLAASQRTVAVIDGDVFDRLFSGVVDANDEGRVVTIDGRIGVPFTAEAIDRLETRLSSGAVTLLRLAWRDRLLLLR
ncbi:helix-turn-helix transcriptional regulator [Saccharothrix obliqua]|uniref:helix-turn-helix transcriptional regulator n=1 Tax=Saccharothrix obliqua TaxID=2861747 RepID=UPI001C5DB99C|nr:helix-turn-helix transcriptional regulator [Saccharothrix obliqua]MBW4717398.1 helix-turn-helix domain-containing protein [Saccharothrix obliqua]